MLAAKEERQHPEISGKAEPDSSRAVKPLKFVLLAGVKIFQLAKKLETAHLNADLIGAIARLDFGSQADLFEK